MNDLMLDYDEYEIQCNVDGFGMCRVTVTRAQAIGKARFAWGAESDEEALLDFVEILQPTPVGLPRSIKEKVSGVPD